MESKVTPRVADAVEQAGAKRTIGSTIQVMNAHCKLMLTKERRTA